MPNITFILEQIILHITFANRIVVGAKRIDLPDESKDFGIGLRH